MSDVERAKRRLDSFCDRFKDSIGPGTVEVLLQVRAQDMRELSQEAEDQPVIDYEDVEGYSQ